MRLCSSHTGKTDVDSLHNFVPQLLFGLRREVRSEQAKAHLVVSPYVRNRAAFGISTDAKKVAGYGPQGPCKPLTPHTTGHRMRPPHPANHRRLPRHAKPLLTFF